MGSRSQGATRRHADATVEHRLEPCVEIMEVRPIRLIRMISKTATRPHRRQVRFPVPNALRFVLRLGFAMGAGWAWFGFVW